MIIGTGIDVVELDRIIRSYTKFGKRFLKKILTTQEQNNLPKHPAAYIASRFAAKEACVKALGTGFSQGIFFDQIDIVSLPSGQPTIKLSGPALKRSKDLDVHNIHLSITHGRDIASAIVILEGR
ncbi:MAG: holo-[acyl-carrier-protein] synthase [Desulfoplanes sp.]|nr:holo-[acyl-carrier-protein] synthase [Desulfoplanes sp.]